MPNFDPTLEKERLSDEPGPGAEMDRDPSGDAPEEDKPSHQPENAPSEDAREDAPEEEEDDGEDEDEEDDEEEYEDEDDEEEEDDTPKGGKMTIMAHLTELRKRLFACVACFLVAFTLCMSRSEWFTDLLLTRGSQFSFVYISPAELLMTYIRIALIGGVVVTVPVIIFEIWKFLSPGLRKREQLGFFVVMAFGLALFVLGALFAFAIVLPILLAFFARLETTNTVQAMVSVEEYVNYVVSNMVTFGIIFETPIVVLTLTGIGLVKPKTLQKNFKYMVLIILTVAAIITPPDVTSQILVALPLMLLFYGSIVLSQIVFRRKLAQREREEAELYGD